MKKKIVLSALLLALPLFLTACTLQDLPVIGPVIGRFFPDTKPQGPVTLNVWGLWENPEVMDLLAKKYQETNPDIQITYDDRSVLKSGEYKDNVFNRLKEQNAPDIVVVHNSWVPYLKESLEPMPGNLMANQEYLDKFYPSAVSVALLDNQIFAVPAFYDGLLMVYNKAHFAEINQTEPPTSWEELRRVSLNLTKRDEDDNITRGGAALGSSQNIEFFSDIIGLMFAQAGVSVPDGLDSKSAQDALTFYTNFVGADKVWNNTLPEASVAFVQEKASIVFVPSWALLDILEARPDLDIGVSAMPQPPIPNPVSWGSFWMYAVPKNSPNKSYAWEYIAFLAKDEQQQTMYSEASKYRQFGAPYSSKSLSPLLTSDSFLRPLLDTANFSKISILAGRAGNDRVVGLLKEAVNYVLSVNKAQDANPSETALKKAKTDLLSVPTR